MAEEKYYTPSLKDMFHGLEIRRKKLDEYHNEHWIPANHDISKHHIEVGRLGTDNSKLKNIKVKYLDAKDIKELGWDFAMGSLLGDVHSEPMIFAKEGLIFKFIPKESQIVISNKTDTIYNGKCYNKSELRWIMERLGINTEK